MSFLHPGRLALLLVVAALVGAYALVQLRRRRAAAAYANPTQLARLASPRSAWRRHVPVALALAGLATLVVAIAQPTSMHRVARERGVVVLALDVSNSMSATDIAPNRLQAAIAGASSFVDDLPDGIDVGLVAFDGTASTVVVPTDDHASVVKAVKGLTTGPRTAAGEGIYNALDAIHTTVGDSKAEIPAAVVLLSDGATTYGRPVAQAAQAAADEGVPVTTIAYGTPDGTVTVAGQVVDVPADTATMREVAETTGGTAFEATTAGQLHDVYQHIQTAIGYTQEPHEVTTAWMAGALLVVLAAVGTALLTTSRPV